MTMRVSVGVRDGAASAFATEVDAGAGTSVLELRSGTPPTRPVSEATVSPASSAPTAPSRLRRRSPTWSPTSETR